MSAPKRIQLRRTKGWRKPAGAIVVARPTRWGNSFVPIHDLHGQRWLVARRTTKPTVLHLLSEVHARPTMREAIEQCCELYRQSIIASCVDLIDADTEEEAIAEGLADLRGHDLACWCPLDQPCHADILLELANGGA